MSSSVARHYESLGYTVLERNWRCREGELDLVLRHGRTLVVCEVKTRSSAAYGTPAEAVTSAKQQKLRLLTRRYLQAAPFRPREIRFDVAAVLAGELELIEAAF